MPSSAGRFAPSLLFSSPIRAARREWASGEALVITDHGRPTLEVRPFRSSDPGAADPLRQLRGSVLLDNDPFSLVADGEWAAQA